MKRSAFLLISAIIAALFSLGMMLSPSSFTAGISTDTPTAAVNAWAQFLGTNLFAIGVMNFLARKSEWSDSLRAIMIGNIVLHGLALIFDGYSSAQGVITTQGFIQGAVVHLVFIVGFLFYTINGARSRDVVS